VRAPGWMVVMAVTYAPLSRPHGRTSRVFIAAHTPDPSGYHA